MLKYKLTNQLMQTHNSFQWELGVTKTTSGEGELCGPGYLHYYHSPLLAVLLNSIHANISDPKLFEVEAEGTHLDDKGLKGGCTQMTLIREIELPLITDDQRRAFAILVVKEIYKDEKWNAWADKWLSGEDRSQKAAAEAAWAARAAAEAAWAARAAAEVAWAARAARAAAEAAEAAWAAAEAAWAARAADIDFQVIAEKALKY